MKANVKNMPMVKENFQCSTVWARRRKDIAQSIRVSGHIPVLC